MKNKAPKRDFDMRPEVVIDLYFPKEVDGTLHKSFTMRRPLTEDSMLAAKVKGSDHDRGIFLLARLCGTSPDVIEKLDEVDTDVMSEQLQAFKGRQSAA